MPIISPLIWWAIGVLFALVLIFFAYRRFRSRDRSDPVESAPPVPAEEIAITALNELRSKASEIAPDPFTVKVSDIVRSYLESALKLPAPELTTEEFLEKTNSDKDTPIFIKEIVPGFLERCDQVKFAQQSLEDVAKMELLDQADTVVKKTHQQLSNPLNSESTAK